MDDFFDDEIGDGALLDLGGLNGDDTCRSQLFTNKFTVALDLSGPNDEPVPKKAASVRFQLRRPKPMTN